MVNTNEGQYPRVVQGKVKWFDPVKGFGFVLAETGGPDILLHANVLRNFGQSSVADEARIEIEVMETERGMQATTVLSIQPPETATFTTLEGVEDADIEAFDDLPLEPARVKWFDKGKGFGFANVFGKPDDVFIHIEVLRRSGLADLQPGEAVCLSAREGKRGMMAVLVKTWDAVVDASV